MVIGIAEKSFTMLVSSRGSLWGLLRWQWQNVIFFASLGAIPPALLMFLPASTGALIRLPATPVTVVGAALGIFVSFRTNSAYDRWWEGRKLWGRMINSSRHFASQVAHYVTDQSVRNRMIWRHASYVHALRCSLRTQHAFKDPDFSRTFQDADASLESASNLTHRLLHLQLQQVRELEHASTLSEFKLQRLDSTLERFLDIQGGCERIKKTPLPRGYGFIAERLIWAFAATFPFVVVQDLGWLVVPANVLVCLSFALISEAGRVLEDPFTMFFNGLPLSQISLMIERNIFECVGIESVPEVPKPDERGVLM